MPGSRQSRYKDRYDKLLDDSLAIVNATNFTAAELAQTAEDAFKRIPGAVLVPIDRIEPNADNPRHVINESAMADLASSIAERGLLQPLVVRRNADRPGYYVVIAGSRRLLATRLVHSDPDEEIRARVALLPCIIKETSDRDAFADALLENLARSDLSRADMMEALLRLHTEYGWSSHYIARRTGRNQSDIAQLLGVARHPDLAQLVRQEVIKPTVAGEINRLPEPVREATIAEVKAGTVRTVADVRSRRPPRPALAGTPASGPAALPGVPIGEPIESRTTDRVISLTPESPATQPSPEAGQADSTAMDRVISLTPEAPAESLASQIEALGALVAMVDAETTAGQAMLRAVGRDVAAAYEKLAAYLARRDRHDS